MGESRTKSLLNIGDTALRIDDHVMIPTVESDAVVDERWLGRNFADHLTIAPCSPLTCVLSILVLSRDAILDQVFDKLSRHVLLSENARFEDQGRRRLACSEYFSR